MIVMERLESERIFHNFQASDRAAYYARHAQDLFVKDENYLAHESWIRPAFRMLGDLHGRDLLDYGCGHGMASVVMARQGARVVGFDLSEGYIREAQLRAKVNQVDIQFQVADAEELPFHDHSFDAVWGCAILHHLDLAKAGRELRRILRPHGVAVFCEPWGGNPLLSLVRRYLPYPGKHRTRDEKPLQNSDLDPLRIHFPSLQMHGFQLLGMFRRFWNREPGTNSRIDRWDQSLLAHVPILQNWCRYMVIVLRA